MLKVEDIGLKCVQLSSPNLHQKFLFEPYPNPEGKAFPVGSTGSLSHTISDHVLVCWFHMLCI